MKMTELLFLWHQWRWACWSARAQAAECGGDVLEQTGVRDAVRGEVWMVKLYMARVRAQMMKDYHKSRTEHFRLMLGF